MKSKDSKKYNSTGMPDLSLYKSSYENEMVDKITKLHIDREDADALAGAGILVDSENRSSTMVVRDNQPICLQNDTKDFEMMPIAAALKKYEWLKDRYFFKAVPSDFDEVVATCRNQENPLGFYIHVHKGAKVKLPCQAAMYMTNNNSSQIVHNVVILEDDSELQLITGCLTRHDVNSGLHIAVEEHYIGKNAKLVSTMVHSWGNEVKVYPHTGTIVQDGGRFESNYVSLRPAGHIVSSPQTWLNGKGASAKYTTVVLAAPGSIIETSGSVYLNAEDTSAELVHRGVCTGGIMYQGGLLIGAAPCKAHVDCAGMLLDSGESGYIESVPGLKSLHSDAKMSHEASIGKIVPDQVEYLMSRGLAEREAVSMLIRGFLGADIEGLGDELDTRVAEIAEVAGHGEE